MLFLSVFLLSCAAATDFTQLLQSPAALLNAYKEFRVENPAHDASSLRLKIFRNTVKMIAEENSLNEGYTMGLNYFADMTEEEKQQYLGLNGTQRRGEEEGEVMPGVGELPKEKLWLDSVTEVKNQAKCGSCWTFGANGALETAYKLKTGVLRAFSEQELLDCVYGYDGCGGGWPKDCFKYAQKGRLGAMADIPYTMTSGDCKPTIDGKPNALRAAKVTGYKFLEKTEEATVAGLATIGALSVCFEVTSKTFQYHKGIYKDRTCRAAWANHAVTAVGYTEKYILVKNSWGNRWGDNGFVKFTRGYSNCHLYDEASYPILVSTGVTDDVPSDAATPYVPNPDEDEDDFVPCFDEGSPCNNGMCNFASFAKRFCQKTCGYCESNDDDDDGKCPGGTVKCDDGVCRHEHMC